MNTSNNFRNYLFFVISALSINFSVTLKSQPLDGEYPSQFLFPEFSMGKVLMKNGSVQSILLNYNILSGKIVVKKNGDFFNFQNQEMLDTVFIQGYKFVTEGKGFISVLYSAPIALFVQHKGELVPVGKPAAYGGTSQLSATQELSSVELSGINLNLKLPPEYLIRSHRLFIIRKDNILYNFENERQFLKIFPGKEAEIKQYIKTGRLKFDKYPDMVDLVAFCNSLDS